MSKTTTKTTTVTEEFDKDGNVTKRETVTSEETFEDNAPNYVPNPSPWVQPLIGWGGGQISTVDCACGTGKPCYKHTTVINTTNTNPTAFTVTIGEGSYTTPQDAVSPDYLEDEEQPPCECQLCRRACTETEVEYEDVDDVEGTQRCDDDNCWCQDA